MQAFHAMITGRVQGVFFRVTTAEFARSLSITGWVRNRPSGAVEVWAQGEDQSLARFRTFLEVGPSGAVVDELVAVDVDVDPSLEGFAIR